MHRSSLKSTDDVRQAKGRENVVTATQGEIPASKSLTVLISFLSSARWRTALGSGVYELACRTGGNRHNHET
jgi:hypothetical protein